MPPRRVTRFPALIVLAVLSIGAAWLIARAITPRPRPTTEQLFNQHPIIAGQKLEQALEPLDTPPSTSVDFQSPDEMSRALQKAFARDPFECEPLPFREIDALRALTSEFLYYRFGQRSPEVYRRWRTARGDRPIDPAVLRSSGAVENWMLYTKQVTAVTDAKLPATIDPDLIFDQSWDAAIDHVAGGGFRPTRLITEQSTFFAIPIPLDHTDRSPSPQDLVMILRQGLCANYPEPANPASMCAFFVPPRTEPELLTAERRAVVGLVTIIVQSADGVRRLWFLRFVRSASAPCRGATPASWHLQSWSIINPASASGQQEVLPYVPF